MKRQQNKNAMTDYLENKYTDTNENQQPQIAALYARVSTGRQEKEETIESQIEEVKRKIETDGNILSPKHLFIDDGWTGSILARPALDTMRDAVKEGEIQLIYVYDLGRLSRDFTNQLILLKEFEQAGIKFISLRDINPTNPLEGVLQKIMGIFHDYDRLNIAEKFRRGKLHKARSGILINGSAKYGWSYVKKTETVPAHYEVNEKEAEAVRLICDWFGNEQVSIYEIIRRLYDKGIPPRKGKSPFWTKGPIVRLLQCESYFTGTVYYNKSEAVVAKNPIKNDKYKRVNKTSRKERPKEDWIPFKVSPIVADYSLYQRIQKRLDYNKKYSHKNRKFNYLLTELIYCQCGNRRVGDGCSKNGHFYYRCIERIKKFPLKHKCTLPGVNAEILDAVTWNELVKVLSNPEVLKKCVNQWMQIQANNEYDEMEKRKLNEAEAKITEEEKRYAKAYGAGTLEFEQFQEVMKDAKKRKLALERQLDDIAAKSSQESIDVSVDDYLKYAKQYLEKLDFSNKLQVVRDIIGKVLIKERSEVEVWAHIPLQFQLATQKLGYEPIGRDCWFAKCGKIYFV